MSMKYSGWFQEYVTCLLNTELQIPDTQSASFYLKPGQKGLHVLKTIPLYSQYPQLCFGSNKNICDNMFF